MSKKTDIFYNNFSTLYPLVDIFYKPQKRKLFELINNLPFGQLLEIGVGNGTHFQLYKTHKVIGIDTSSKMLENANKYKKDNITLEHMNGESLSFPDQTFDYIVMSHVISVIDNPEKMLEESYRVLKPNGRIYILNHFTPGNWLRYFDNSIQTISKRLHFKSVFHIESLNAIKKFTLLKEITFSKFSYFKLLIYCKA